MCVLMYLNLSFCEIRFHSSILLHTPFNLDRRNSAFDDDHNSNVTVTVTEIECDILFACDRTFVACVVFGRFCINTRLESKAKRKRMDK